MTEPTDTADPAVDAVDGEPVPLSPTAPLRVAGFLATVLGAALMGGGATMHWVTVNYALAGQGHEILNPQYKGTDISNGKVVLVAAAALLLGFMALRALRSRHAQGAVAGLMVIAAVIGVAFSVSFLADGGHRLLVQPTDTATLGVGVLITLAGAVVALLGAILDLVWSVAPH